MTTNSEQATAMQLGYRNTLGSLHFAKKLDILCSDIHEVTRFSAPGNGIRNSCSFKSYAPNVFKYFMDFNQIQTAVLLSSLCDAPLRELTNPGASGASLYLTDDDKFIIKTVSQKEKTFLLKLLTGYFMNICQNAETYLPKFYGLHRYQSHSKSVHLICMNNLLPTSIKLHEKYDLKGSTYKREASEAERSKSSPTFKDLDFRKNHPGGIMLDAKDYEVVIGTIQRDCRVLESFKIMDYSLLLAVHNLDVAAREEAGSSHTKSTYQDQNGNENAAADTRPTSAGPSAAFSCDVVSPLELSAIESIETETVEKLEGVRAIPARNAKGERLLLFFGIIDILQNYGLKKKLEHFVKANLHGADAVSVTNPMSYSIRFQNFLAQSVFKELPNLPIRSSRPLPPAFVGDLRSSAFDNERSDPLSTKSTASSTLVRVDDGQQGPASSPGHIANLDSRKSDERRYMGVRLKATLLPTSRTKSSNQNDDETKAHRNHNGIGAKNNRKWRRDLQFGREFTSGVIQLKEASDRPLQPH